MHHMPTRMRMAYAVCQYIVEALRGSPYGVLIPSYRYTYDVRLDPMSVNGVPPKWRPTRRVGHRVASWAGPNAT